MDELNNKTLKEIYKKLDTSKTGLSNKEVTKRKRRYGLNKLNDSKKQSVFNILLSSVNNPIIYVLLCAAILSIIANEKVDAIAIIIIILIDAVVNTIQEYSAQKSNEALKNLIVVKTKVLRENKYYELDSKEIVPGDIVIIEPGYKVPADIRIIECTNLTIDESILSGESIGVEKTNKDNVTDKSNMIYAGTSVLTGHGIGVVLYTGLKTEIGKIAITVNNTEEELSPLTIRMNKFSKQISIIIIVISIILGIILYLKGNDLITVFISMIALSISAMPEGLPLAVTLCLTMGSKSMIKKSVLVKKLNCVESLGSCTVIATDKTGTLTVNEQTAKKILLASGEMYEIDGSGYNLKGDIRCIDNSNIENAKYISYLGAINNDATFEKDDNGKWIYSSDPIDVAFKVLAGKLELASNAQIIHKIPYESSLKYSSVFYEKNDEVWCSAKGSIEEILKMCTYSYNKGRRVKLNKEKIIEQNNSLASSGYRIIAICDGKVDKKETYSKKDIKDLTFIGLVAFQDPVRNGVLNSIRKCKRAGIKVCMITGDHKLTSYSIAKEIKICDSLDQVTTEDELLSLPNDVIFDEFIKNKTVFSRISPLMKLKIVESLKRQGEYVAVTGDGVNDAPAIKCANIGISMGNGTDVTKDTAKMIITDDDFSSIVSGIEEGRNAYANIRKISIFLLSCALSEVLFFLLSIVFDLPMPLVAIQLLWLNIVTDGLQDVSLSFEKENEIFMKDKPRKPNENIFEPKLLNQVITSGIYMGIVVFVVWYALIKVLNVEVSLARSYILLLMVFMQNFHAFNCRSESKSIFSPELKGNYFLFISILLTLLLQIVVFDSPKLVDFLGLQSISYLNMIFIAMMACPIVLIMEINKAIRRKKERINM